ncbi:MAG: TIGR04283 family arsenosugar biosynthesis glycosyltransferase [Rhodobacteraceae bacterium]|nr:TIGR04283 family arsenosugar biosynthesis glycosyltransferase [Paracoccaceae bacterium]
MAAKISIVIPTLNAEADLPRCLISLMEGLREGMIRELIIADGGSTDLTLDIAEDAGAEIVSSAPSRGGQLRRGVAATKGAWVLVLHADTVLSPGWAEAVAMHVAHSRDPAYFRLAFRAPGWMPVWVAGWANLRSAIWGLPYGDQGLLVTRAQYEAAGGFPDQPLMEDVALARRLGCPLVALSAVATTSADRYLRDGWFRRGARNLWTLTRYRFGADPKDLVASYRR